VTKNNLPALVPQVPPADLVATQPRVTADPILTEHACEIRKLGNRAKDDIIEIGRRLKDARNRTRGRWLKWLDTELGWSASTAERFIAVYEFSQAEEFEFVKLTNLTLPVSAIYLLAAPSTPIEARTEIIEAAKAGESIPIAKVKTAIARARGRPSTSKPKTAPSAFDASVCWMNAMPAERAHPLDDVGPRAVFDAAPPSWCQENIDANTVGQVALQDMRIEEPEAEVKARDRARKPDFVQRRFEQNLLCIRESCEATVDMALPPDLESEDAAAAVTSLTASKKLIDKLLQRLRSQRQLLAVYLDIPDFLRRAPAGTGSAASGTPPVAAVGSSNGGITMRSE
jgi:hypothetical protein